MSFQQLVIVGNVGRDPELRYIQNGIAVTDFSIAVTRKRNDQDGNQQETTTWYKVTCWRKTAEIVSQYVRKGKQVLVVATQIETETFQARDGQTRVQIKVTADDVRLLGGRGDDNKSGASSSGDGYNPTADFSQNPYGLGDIPF
jgi:single-strand DNA-binding protein